MGRLHANAGWILFVSGSPQGYVMFGPVVYWDLSVTSSSIDVTSAGSPGRLFVPGSRTVKVTAEVPGAQVIHARGTDTAMWEALQTYPQKDRRFPAELEAMMELAERHPDEYTALLAHKRTRRGFFRVRRKGGEEIVQQG